jgi:probable HAF family extracellular repeat protein
VISRRQWLRTLGFVLGASARPRTVLAILGSNPEPNSQPAAKTAPLPLAEYEPKSMLHVQETHVERARFPVVDVHTHMQVAGDSLTNSIPNPVSDVCGSNLPTQEPFLWEKDKGMTSLGTLGGTCGSTFGLNNGGQVIGFSDLAGDLTLHPFLWERGSLTDLGTLGGSFGIAYGINNSGEVVGWATNKNDQAQLAFLWKGGVMTNLGTLNGDDCSIAFHINSKGQIVGISFPCASPVFPNFHGFLWQNGFMTDLNAFAPPGSSLTTWGDGIFINDRGEIAGLRVLPDGDLHAFLLVPCGEGTDGCVDAVEDAAATSNIPARSAGMPTTSIQRHLTPAGMLAAWGARFAQRYRIPSPPMPRN